MIFNRLKEMRKERNMTQQQLAEQLHISPQVYSRYEKGDREMPISLLMEISNLFGVSVDYLLDSDTITEDEEVRKMYKKFVELLQKNNTTAYQVSKATGVSQSTLSDWKTGRATPKVDKLCKIAEYFGVTINYLLDSDTIKEKERNVMNFGENLREHRIAVGLTQAQLAEELSLAPSSISLWESGDRKPDIIFLKQLANIFGCTTDELLDTAEICAERQDYEDQTEETETPENSVDIKNILLEQAALIRQESKKTPDKLPELTEALCKVTAMLIILSRKADEPT